MRELGTEDGRARAQPRCDNALLETSARVPGAFSNDVCLCAAFCRD
jgi:hypothetical protein